MKRERHEKRTAVDLMAAPASPVRSWSVRCGGNSRERGSLDAIEGTVDSRGGS